jgi:hydrogenase expression/formation protein HypE
MAVKGILFDFDGTLTRPGALDFPAIKRELGCPPDQPILEYIATQPAYRRPGLMKILEEREDLAAENSIPNRGTEKCLSALKDKGLILGILTRNSLRSVEKSFKRFKNVSIHDFAAVVTREVSLPKPHPDGVLEAARQMGLNASELLVVGDFRFDVMAGKAAGAGTVLLTDGNSVMAPGDPEPDYTVTHIKDILDLLGPEPISIAYLPVNR